MKQISENGNFEIDGNIFDKGDVLDLYRLQKQLLFEENILASLEDCAKIWIGYSNDLSASWLFFPQNDWDILRQIKDNQYFQSFEKYIS